jgi:hypothetical protein
MRTKLLFISLAGCLLIAGCEVIALGTHNALHELGDYRDKRLIREDSWTLAIEEWDRVRLESPDSPYSTDYKRGFLDGFADYLGGEGNGEPPLLPPNCYLRARNQNSQGFLAVEDWFAGYRQGASRAHATGLRQFIIVPYSCPCPVTLQNLPSLAERTNLEPDAAKEIILPERLPVPQKIEPR